MILIKTASRTNSLSLSPHSSGYWIFSYSILNPFSIIIKSLFFFRATINLSPSIFPHIWKNSWEIDLFSTWKFEIWREMKTEDGERLLNIRKIWKKWTRENWRFEPKSFGWQFQRFTHFADSSTSSCLLILSL